MGKVLHRNIDYDAPLKKGSLRSDRVGEDAENLPKKEGQAHYGTWRYKRGFVYQAVIERMMKKHVDEPYGVLYAEIAKKFKTGSLERLHIERDLVSMSKNDGDDPPYLGGYFIDSKGIIRYAQKVGGVMKVVK
jgi:hypothetical protein